MRVYGRRLASDELDKIAPPTTSGVFTPASTWAPLLHTTVMPLLPAILALRDILPSVLGPPLVTYALTRLAPPAPLLPLWLALPLCVLAAPVFFVARAFWRRAIAAREAKRRGARLIPWVADGWLGRGVVRASTDNFANGYLGASI
jgi:hypothetical protein